jgi:hypothetical protein
MADEKDTAGGEREAARREIADLEQQRRDLDARLIERRAMLRMGTFNADTPFEVMVDSLGALGEHVKGDIIRMGDGPYDLAWLERSGSVRRLSSDEARLLEQRPMASTTRPLASDGSVDLGAQAGALDAFGVAGDALDADIMAEDMEADRQERRDAAKAGEVVVRETTDMGPDTPKEPAGQAKPTTGGRGR